MEVSGRDNLPSSGPIIIALNHANSLADSAVSMTALTPLLIRYTCKDTLLRDPRFGFIIRGAKCIGIKRKQDYQNQKVDNQDAFNQLFNELANNSIIAMYPEGVGKYKSDLSPFRTGLARIAVNFILKNQSKSVNIVPVGMTYLHREKFRSSVAVRIGKPILINIDILKQKKQKLFPDNVNTKTSMTTDEIYQIGKDINDELIERFKNLVISSPDWNMLALSHLARQIAFPQSSSPRHGTFLTHYVDLTRQFNIVFKDNLSKTDEFVSKSYTELDAYWKILWKNGLKDNRILELTNYKRNDTSWIYKKCSYLMRFIYRSISSFVLCGISLPGMISSLPIYLLWNRERNRRIKKGIEGNFDGLAMNKMFMITFGIPVLNFLYSFGIGYKFGWSKSFLFGLTYPLLLWLSVRGWQDGYSSLKSALSCLKLFFMNNKKENMLIECREKNSNLISSIVDKYGIKYDDNIMNDTDRNLSPLTIRHRMPWLQQKINGRIKNDWNETIRLYDVPTDEFHLNPKYQLQNDN